MPGYIFFGVELIVPPLVEVFLQPSIGFENCWELQLRYDDKWGVVALPQALVEDQAAAQHVVPELVARKLREMGAEAVSA